jgi:hypothetical protein
MPAPCSWAYKTLNQNKRLSFIKPSLKNFVIVLQNELRQVKERRIRRKERGRKQENRTGEVTTN